MGVVFARFAESDRIIALAKNSDRNLETQDVPETVADAAAPEGAAPEASVPDETPAMKEEVDEQ
jgi:DNA gyrase subunit A